MTLIPAQRGSELHSLFWITSFCLPVDSLGASTVVAVSATSGLRYYCSRPPKPGVLFQREAHLVSQSELPFQSVLLPLIRYLQSDKRLCPVTRKSNFLSLNAYTSQNCDLSEEPSDVSSCRWQTVKSWVLAHAAYGVGCSRRRGKWQALLVKQYTAVWSESCLVRYFFTYLT